MAIVHISANIKFLLRNFSDKQLDGLSEKMSGKEARKVLQKLSDKGDVFIGAEGCTHFDPKLGCQCRYHEDE